MPKDYNPGSLSVDAKNAFDEMQNAAKNDNIKLWIASGYRSYSLQTNLYNSYVLKDGKTKADIQQDQDILNIKQDLQWI